MIEIDPSDIPLWTEDAKFKRLKELESNVKQMDKEIKDLSGYLPLLFAKAEILVDAVIKALRFLGLEAEHTERGFTADVLAQSEDQTKRFGIQSEFSVAVFSVLWYDSRKL